MPCRPATNVAMNGPSAAPWLSGSLSTAAKGYASTRMSSNPTERRSALSVRGSDGWARCSSHARKTRVVKTGSRDWSDTVAQSTSQTTARPPGRSARRLEAVEAGPTTDVEDSLAGRGGEGLANERSPTRGIADHVERLDPLGRVSVELQLAQGPPRLAGGRRLSSLQSCWATACRAGFELKAGKEVNRSGV
jgi:hypothetical protein